MVKNPPVNSGDPGDVGSIPGLGRSPEGGNGNPLQYSCMENPMERSLTGYSPQGCKELDLTESLSTLAQSIELRLWVLNRASLTSTSVNSNPLFLGFPDFVCPSLEEVSKRS